MKINIVKKGLDSNLNEIKVVVKYDSMGINQGTFYVDADGEFEMSEYMANTLSKKMYVFAKNKPGRKEKMTTYILTIID